MRNREIEAERRARTRAQEELDEIFEKIEERRRKIQPWETASDPTINSLYKKADALARRIDAEGV